MNTVEIACICPGTPHERDTVTLKDPLPFREAVTIRKSIQWMKDQEPNATIPELLAMLTETYLLHTIEAWTLVDEKGKPLPPSKDNIAAVLLPQTEAALVVGDACDELYTERVILPLVAAAPTSSPSSSTNGSTSPKPEATPRTPSRPSSTSITQTAGTAVMTT